MKKAYNIATGLLAIFAYFLGLYVMIAQPEKSADRNSTIMLCGFIQGVLFTILFLLTIPAPAPPAKNNFTSHLN